jgi:hypothetical protein
MSDYCNCASPAGFGTERPVSCVNCHRRTVLYTLARFATQHFSPQGRGWGRDNVSAPRNPPYVVGGEPSCVFPSRSDKRSNPARAAGRHGVLALYWPRPGPGHEHKGSFVFQAGALHANLAVSSGSLKLQAPPATCVFRLFHLTHSLRRVSTVPPATCPVCIPPYGWALHFFPCLETALTCRLVARKGGS